MAKAKYPDAKLVFIGPCVGKRKEIADSELVDYMLTFEEVDTLFNGLSIEMKELDNSGECAPMAGRGFARAVGSVGRCGNSGGERPRGLVVD